MNDLKIPNNNISVCEPSVLCEPNVLCTKRTNPETNISQHILPQSHYQEQKSNLSESQILENQGQVRNSKNSQEKAWNPYSANYKSVLCLHSTLRPKEAKYKFPSVDPAPIDGLLQYSPKDLYIFLINLCYHRLPPDTYKQWCELAERDVCFPEMSKDGVLETSYSLKHQREQFKKSRKKKAIIAESNILLPKVEE